MFLILPIAQNKSPVGRNSKLAEKDSRQSR
jgi:hypothetical protein